MKGIKYLGKDMRKVKALVLLCLCYILSLLVGCRVQCSNDRERYEAEILRLNEAHAAELEAVVAKAEAGIYASQYLPDSAEGDILPLARWLGCLEKLYPGISTEAKTLACWVVFNRVTRLSIQTTWRACCSSRTSFRSMTPWPLPRRVIIPLRQIR